MQKVLNNNKKKEVPSGKNLAVQINVLSNAV